MQENSQSAMKMPTFRDRDFEEVEDGYYDANGYYITPNGSFWDENQNYFNRDGFDKHGGIFDEYGTYIPGPDWNEDFCCYNSVLVQNQMNVNKEALQHAIHEHLKGELLDDYHYYQNFFSTDETVNLYNLEVPVNQECPLKDEYSYNYTMNNVQPVIGTGNFDSTNVARSAVPTPGKKVDTVSMSKSPMKQF
jgi:hypothetical protein